VVGALTCGNVGVAEVDTWPPCSEWLHRPALRPTRRLVECVRLAEARSEVVMHLAGGSWTRM
jgi:hypothetical protein